MHTMKTKKDEPTCSVATPVNVIRAKKVFLGNSTILEHPHSFEEHTYKSPTYCDICDGLLVGFWSQGYKCKHCGMNTHRGQGVGDHDDCRKEALLASCPGPNAEQDLRKSVKEAKLGDVMAQIRDLAKDPNFIKDVTEQFDKDIKSKARSAITAAAVDDEREMKLKRLKLFVLRSIRYMDAITEKGELYVMMILLSIIAISTVLQTFLSFGSLIIVLSPRYGLFTTTSFQLAAMHDATVTAAFHTVFAIVSGIFYYLACVFKRKNVIFDRFLKDAMKLDAEIDIGISIAEAAERCKYLSHRILISSIISVFVSFNFWRFSQPPAWEAAPMPPVAKIFVPVFFSTVYSSAVAYLSYRNFPDSRPIADLSRKLYNCKKDENLKTVDEQETSSSHN